MEFDDYNSSEIFWTLNQTICGMKPARPGFCPEVFDKELCWPETPAGTIANQSCPLSVGYDPTRLAFRECWPNATWFTLKDNKTWSNYTKCIDMEYLEFMMFINDCYVIGYSISLAALLISLWIFMSFRSLRCTRIRIHTQLFISFALNNIVWIIHYEVVIPNPILTIGNPVWCQILHVVIHYFMLANYMWMFCEGLHLHLALVVVFVREEVTMRWFFAVGWGAPLIFVGMYSLFRIFVSKDTLICWLEDSYDSKLILTIPVLISLLSSLFFLINVLRVILTIMHPNSPNPAPMGVKRAARAALILIPLFGLQFILIPFRPEYKDPYEKLYLYVSVIIIPYQGLCVSCLFCFANHDVHQAVKSFVHRKLYRNSRWNNYHYTGAQDSGGVYVLNGNSQTHNMVLLSLKRKSTTTVRL
ncbi:calcitonin receptor-like [Aethina tumida]|uniref:calcitonin receptor-like n=1 Tax=Aethina tumida TaxID=116153 RepID=UPI0021496419|nr:calcitonin receptor-like [Aethina tumida]